MWRVICQVLWSQVATVLERSAQRMFVATESSRCDSCCARCGLSVSQFQVWVVLADHVSGIVAANVGQGPFLDFVYCLVHVLCLGLG